MSVQLTKLRSSARVLTFLTLGVFELLRIGTGSFWRDEYQSWSIAHDAASVWSLATRLRYEGHPPLFYLLEAIPARMELPADAAKAIVAVASVTSLALLYRERRLPAWAVAAMTLSVVWGETLLARSYSLLPTLLLLAVAVRGDGGHARRRLAGYLCLGLLAASHLAGAVAGGAVALRWILTGGWREWRGAALAGAIALASALSVWPAADAESVFRHGGGLSLGYGGRLVAALAAPATNVLPWVVVSLLVLAATSLALTGQRLATWLVALAGTASLSVVSGVSEPRGVVALLALYVLLVAEEPNIVRHRVGLMTLLLIGALGLQPLGQSITRPRSDISKAIVVTRTEAPLDATFVATPDYLATAFAVELGVRAWTPECSCEISSVYWTRSRNSAADDPARMLTLALDHAAELRSSGRPVVLILSADAPAPVGGRLLVKTSGGIHADEATAVYLYPATAP